MAFSMTCTSAAAERVFSLVEAMYGHEQRSALADQLQAALMLRYNKRMVGRVVVLQTLDWLHLAQGKSHT